MFNSKPKRLIPLFLLITVSLFMNASSAHAQAIPEGKIKKPRRPFMEISALGSMSRSNYGNGSYSKSTRVTGAIAIYLTTTTEIEATYTDERTLVNYEPSPKTITKTRERVAGVSLNQALLPRHFFFQPYVKAGAAQLNRQQQTTYNGTEQPTQTLKQPSGLLGAGIRLNVLSMLSLKVELTTYLPNFHIRQAKENYEWDAGISLHL